MTATIPEDQEYANYLNILAPTIYEITLDEQDWDYSRTTGKYRNEFLGEGIEQTRKKIKEGTYKLENLNRY